MAKPLTPKYAIGDEVRFIGDHQRNYGKVLDFYYSADAQSWFYRITSRAVDNESMEVIEGVKICREDELQKVENKNAK